ncbi:hypothetical protein J4410_02960 [Candidatus Woesearchaeota archaeon]|nr:hypothetical protein [Candidatus Woesearchaeota archaeon]
MGDKKDTPEKKINLWFTLGLAAIILLIFFSCNKSPEVQETQQEPQNQVEPSQIIPEEQPVIREENKEEVQKEEIPSSQEVLSLTDVFASSDPAHCTFMIQSTEVEIYKEGDHFLQKAIQDDLVITTLHTEGILYTWTSDGIGKKVDLRALARSGYADALPKDPTQPSGTFLKKASKISCDKNFPERIFNPPTHIPFQDMNKALEEAIKEARTDAAYAREGYQRPSI